MKIVTSCPHITPDPKKWFNAADDGKYAMIIEMCQPCMAVAILSQEEGVEAEIYDPLGLFKHSLPGIKRYEE